MPKISEVYKFPMTYNDLLKQSNGIKKKLLEVQTQTNTIHQQGNTGPQRDFYS